MGINTQTLYQLSTNTWKKIYETTLTDAATSVTISSLDGNTDEEYRLIIRATNSNISDSNIGIRPNNDSGSNYGYQYLYGNDTTIGAARTTFNYFRLGAYFYRNFSDTLIHAKSGYVRTAITTYLTKDESTIFIIGTFGQVWNNTADNITSVVIVSDATNGLGIGTVIELWKKI